MPSLMVRGLDLDLPMLLTGWPTADGSLRLRQLLDGQFDSHKSELAYENQEEGCVLAI